MATIFAGRHRLAGPIATTALALMVAAGSAVGAERVKPSSGPWDAGAGFEFEHKPKKTRRAASGIACPAQGTVCFVAFDEGIEARTVELRDDGYAIRDERIVLLPGADGEKAELDAEGAATDGGFVYVTGSHSAKRSNCASNPDSRHVVRFRVDKTTGGALRQPPGDAAGALVGYADTGRLWALMGKLEPLQAFVGEGKCLGTEPPPDAPWLKGQRGVNIEGLAARDGRLYFGFRGPAEAGRAKVLAVNADALFKDADLHPAVTTLALGEGRGIRDLAAVRDGILILAGPDDDAANQGHGWAVALWDGKPDATPATLAELDLSSVALRDDCDKEIKPEAVAVLADTPEQLRLLVLSDGMCDGGPLTFDVKRK